MLLNSHYTIAVVFTLIFLSPNALGASNFFCKNDDSSIDLVGIWICGDSWLIDETVANQDTNAQTMSWSYVFSTPKFYVVSGVKIKQDGIIDVISRDSPEVILEYWNDTVTETYSEDLDYWISLQTEVSDDYVTFDGFSRLAKFWRVKVEGINGEPPIPRKIAFFARADLPQMQNIEIVMNLPRNPIQSHNMQNAPTSNTCNTVQRPVPRNIVAKYNLERFYSKYTSAYGVPILSHSVVDDKALQRACYVVRFMLAGRKDIRDHMFNNNGRVTIIGRRQTVPMVPEMRQFYWWTRRAAGGTYQLPVNVGAEENMLCERSDGYARSQDIFMHEFAHGVHLIAAYTAIPTFNSRLQGAFDSARRRGLWSNTYANTNNIEYFAEGVQAYFNQQREGPPGGDGIQNNIDTRAELRRHDNNLYKLVEEIFPCSGEFIPRCDDVSQRKSLAQYLELDCSGEGGTGTGGNECTDKNDECRNWFKSGFCKGEYEDYMQANCMKSCGVCSKKNETVVTVTPEERNCKDDNDYCTEWAGAGECEKNPAYMLINCKKSCNTCKGEGTTTTTASTTITASTATTTASTTTTALTTTEGIKDCKDENRSCRSWASRGECELNPNYMLVYCKESCKKCGGPTEKCKNYDNNCSGWSSYCSSNSYVKNNCKKTCGLC